MSLVLSRYRLATFLSCQRHFQLTTTEPLAWPLHPVPAHIELARWRGEQFHLAVERYFRELSPPDSLPKDEQLQSWWQTFRREMPALPAGKQLVEYTLTVPVGHHFITGRFDLLVVNGEQAQIFDWKTEIQPRSLTTLQGDLQTVLYLAMVVQGSAGIFPTGTPIQPDQLKLTYWYVTDPTKSVTISYSEAKHQHNWRWLQNVVADLDEQLEKDESVWELTDNLERCAKCLFQIYCGRQGKMPATPLTDETEEEIGGLPPQLEPTSFF